jgi:hypothetical protein
MTIADKIFKAPQSKAAAYTYAVLVVYVVALSIVKNQSILIITLIPAALSTLFSMYVLNCAVYGKCEIYAWISGQ